MSISVQRALRAGVVAACAGAAMSAAARGGTLFTWDMPTSGVWSAGVNWDPIGTPNGATHSAVIDVGGSAYTVTLDISPALLDFTLNSDDALLTATGRTMTIGGTGQILDGSVTLISSAITGAGSLANSSSMLLEGTSTISTATFDQSGTMLLRGRSGVNTTGTLGSTTENSGLIELSTIEVGASVSMTASGGLTNTGEVRTSVGAGGPRAINASTFVNDGAVALNASTTLGQFGPSGQFTNNSAWSIAAGTTTSMNGAGLTFTQAAGNLDAQGAFEVTNATFNFDGGTITGGGLRLTNGSFNIGEGSTGAGSAVLRGNVALSGDVAGSQTLRLRGESGINTAVTAADMLTNAGLMELTTIQVGASVTMTANSGLANSGEVRTSAGTGGARTINAQSFVNDAFVNLNTSTVLGAAAGMGAFTNNSAWTIAGGTTTSMTGPTLSFTQAGGTLDAQGAFEVADATFNFDGGSITGGGLRLTNGAFNIGDGSVGGAFAVLRGGMTLSGDIAGSQTLRLRGEAGFNTTVTAADAFANGGLIDLTSIQVGANVTLNANGGLTNTGSVQTSLGTGGGRTISASNLTNNAFVSLNASTTLAGPAGLGVFINNGTWTIAPESATTMTGAGLAFTQAGGSLDVLGIFELSSAMFNFSGGTVSGNAPRLTNGALNIGPGSTGAGAFVLRGGASMSGDVAAAQTVTMRGESGFNTAVTAAGPFENAGLIELTTIEVGASVTLNASGGEMTNSGTLRISPGTGGGRAFNGGLVNTGDVEVNASAAFGGASILHRNEGTWTIANGATMTEGATGSGGFVQASGLLDVQGSFHSLNSRFRLEGGDLSGNDVLIQNGALEIASAGNDARFVLIGAPTYSGDVATTHTLTVRGQTGINTTVNAIGSFENRGDMLFTSIEVGATSGLVMATGKLTNRASGDIVFEAGTGGSRFLGVELDNRGDVVVRTASSIGRSGGNSVNIGDIALEGATLSLVGATFTNGVGGLMHGVGGLHTLSVGQFLNSGTISPGESVGLISVTGSFAQSATGVLDIEIAGTGQGNADRMTITGAAALGGMVNATLLGEYAPDWGDRWSILTYQSFTNSMGFTAPTLDDPLLRWWSEATGNAWMLGVRHVADINHDDLVDFGDLNLVLSDFNMVGQGLAGDANEDGMVDFADLNLVVSFFNTAAPPNVVPAPGAGALLLMSLLCGAGRRRRA